MTDTRLISSSVIIFCILINIIILLFVLINKNYNDKRSKVFIGILAINFVLLSSFFIRQFLEGQPNPAYNTTLIWTASIYQATSQVLLLLHIKLTLLFIERKTAVARFTRYTAYVAAAAVCVNLILSASTPFTHVYFYFDEMNRTVLQNALIISDISTFIWAALTLFILMTNRKRLTAKEMGALLSYVMLPTIALVFYLTTLNLQYIVYSITLSILIYFSSIQAEQSKQIKEQELELKQKELELAQSRIASMTSQIRPHFIYNSLAAIKSLIRLDPETAVETVDEFSRYLRHNIDSLSITEPVRLENELQHVETYLSIEQKRFKDQINVTYDIKVREFYLPALTLQPIVENAVRHGITSQRKSGTIAISTEEKDGEITITVSDDGVGFDKNQNTGEDGHVNVGIENVKDRLAAMVGGRLDVQSQIGIGTVVVITIPSSRKGEKTQQTGD